MRTYQKKPNGYVTQQGKTEERHGSMTILGKYGGMVRAREKEATEGQGKRKRRRKYTREAGRNGGRRSNQRSDRPHTATERRHHEEQQWPGDAMYLVRRP